MFVNPALYLSLPPHPFLIPALLAQDKLWQTLKYQEITLMPAELGQEAIEGIEGVAVVVQRAQDPTLIFIQCKI